MLVPQQCRHLSMLPASMWLACQPPAGSVQAAAFLLIARLRLAGHPAPASPALTAGGMLAAGMLLAADCSCCFPAVVEGAHRDSPCQPYWARPHQASCLACWVVAGTAVPCVRCACQGIPPLASVEPAGSLHQVKCIAQGHSVMHSWLTGYLVHSARLKTLRRTMLPCQALSGAMTAGLCLPQPQFAWLLAWSASSPLTPVQKADSSATGWLPIPLLLQTSAVSSSWRPQQSAAATPYSHKLQNWLPDPICMLAVQVREDGGLR